MNLKIIALNLPKKELIVLNKTDLIDENEIKKLLKIFQKIKSEIITLSTFKKICG